MIGTNRCNISLTQVTVQRVMFVSSLFLVLYPRRAICSADCANGAHVASSPDRCLAIVHHLLRARSRGQHSAHTSIPRFPRPNLKDSCTCAKVIRVPGLCAATCGGGPNVHCVSELKVDEVAAQDKVCANDRLLVCKI